MTCIEVSRNHQTFSVPFPLETLSVGRSARCDICLPDKDISRIHLTLQNRDGKILLIDKSSTGTLLNGNPVLKSEIQSGDEIRIGSWTFRVRMTENDDEKTLIRKKQEPTGIFSYHGEDRKLTFTEASFVQTSPLNRTFPITKNIFSIGKDPANDIVLADEYVSACHCKVEFRESKFFLKDLESTNGTFLNRQKILEAYLPDNGVLEIGKARFVFRVDQKTSQVEPLENNDNYFCGMVSADNSMKEVFGLIRSLEQSDAPVLIQGETGTGKELVARAVHENSPRKSRRFIAVNCGAIAKELIESELFGHEKGAFTGAANQREGLFELADGGTLFLDEIGELPVDLQPKLLRVLETGEIRRVGSSKNIHVNVRIIAATHKNLADEVADQRFREDLYYRIYVLPVTLPSLRNRKNDIELLVKHFLNRSKTMHENAMKKLLQHDWPGNIRELKNVLERSLVMSHGKSQITAEHILFAQPIAKALTHRGIIKLEELEKTAIAEALEKNHWRKTDTAEKLGIAKSTLHEKVKKYGIREEQDLF